MVLKLRKTVRARVSENRFQTEVSELRLLLVAVEPPEQKHRQLE